MARCCEPKITMMSDEVENEVWGAFAPLANALTGALIFNTIF